jgi:uncharacterized protein (TIGR00159 family)
MGMSWIQEMGVLGFLDIVLQALLIYSILVLFKKTKAAFVVTGVIIVAGIYLVARQFNLSLMAAIYEKFFPVLLIAIIVIFQEELRHFFEQIAVWSLSPRRTSPKVTRPQRTEVEMLVRTLTDLAREKVGALIVLQGKDLVLRHLDGGENLNGDLSEALLKSLFDPHSMGHDGALIIDKSEVTKFACHLPLSKDIKKLQGSGTRHAAALGLAELTDALCLVVSEERGTISVARQGEIRKVQDPEELIVILEKFYQEIAPSYERKTWRDFFKKNYREKIIAVGFSVLLWMVLIHGSAVTYKTFKIAPEYPQIPKNLAVTEMAPKEVAVTFSGPRSAFFFLGREKIKLFLKTWNFNKGKKIVTISSSDLSYPRNVVLENIEPRKITLQVEERKV